MHCDNCGSEIKVGNKFCESCGSKAAEITGKSKKFNFKPVLIGLILLLLIGGAFAYFGSSLNPKVESSKVVCNPPYIMVGTNCCLDKDSNLICDKDEEKKQAEVTPKPIQQLQDTPYKVCDTKVNLKVAEIDGFKQICYGGSGNTGHIEFRLNNEDEINDVRGLSITVTGEKGTYKNDSITSRIPVGLSSFLNLSYSFNLYGKIKTIKLIPKIEVESSIVPCSDNIIELTSSDMRRCGGNHIMITGAGFEPSIITIGAGETLIFQNFDTTEHWPASAIHPTHQAYPESGGCIGSKFDACKGLNYGEVFTYTFTKKGTWKYHDHLNPSLTGTIVVE